MEILRREIGKLQDLGVIKPAVNSAYASPVPLGSQKEARYISCTGDFRLLNKQTKPDRYALPFLTDFVDCLSGCKIFSSLGNYKSYHQIEIAPEHVHKTTIITPIGSFAFKRLAMGLCGASQTQTRFLNEVLHVFVSFFVIFVMYFDS